MNSEEHAKGHQSKKALVIETITAHCNASAKFDDLREIGAALQAGDKLGIKVLAGGKTNYSYKVYLEESPSRAIFAKLSFTYALWDPDKNAHFDLSRVVNEFDITSRFKGMMEDAPVVTPYLCVDVDDDMKLLVTEWSQADEQFGNQFIDGSVDRRVLGKLGKSLATLHSADVDLSFNESVKEGFTNMFPMQKQVFQEYVEMEETPDKCIAFAKELGLETLHKFVDGLLESHKTSEIVSHGDSHVFNILVEKKPSIETLQQFGDEGSVILCDWEMCTGGSKGGDIGRFQGFPLAAAMAHAVQGNKEAALDILECMFIFWEAYAETMISNGKDDEHLREAYRESWGWAAVFMFLAYYVMHIHMEYLPLEGIPEEDQAKMFGSIGYIALKFYSIAFTDEGKDLSLTQLRAVYREIVVGEIESLDDTRTKGPMRSRRTSVLRETGRRISDASVYEEATRRLSEMPSDCGGRRLSLYSDVLVHETFDDILDEDLS